MLNIVIIVLILVGLTKRAVWFLLQGPSGLLDSFLDIPSLALWLTIHLSLSFAYLVTSIYIKFRSGPVANL